MNIAVVAPSCCIRVIKQAKALVERGHKLFLITERHFKSPLFQTINTYSGTKQLEQSIKMVAPIVDLFHVHNEPSYPATIIREAIPGAKIVFDMHDSNYWRHSLDDRNKYGIRWFEEDTAAMCSDAFIFPSQACMESKADVINGKPSTFVYSSFTMKDLRYAPNPFYGGMVSQGGHVLPTEHPGEHWRNYTDLYKQVISAGKIVYAYSAAFTYNPENPIDKFYTDLGVKIGKFSYQEMLDILGGHEWKLVGNITDNPVWKVAMPNKFFDAMAAGVPSVVFRCDEAAKIVKKYDIGIVVDSVDEFISRWDESAEKRKNLFMVRRQFAMENQVEKIEGVYRALNG